MRPKLLKIATVVACTVTILFAAAEVLGWSLRLSSVERVVATGAAIGVLWWIWTAHGLEWRLGYWQGRADEARARATKVEAGGR